METFIRKSDLQKITELVISIAREVSQRNLNSDKSLNDVRNPVGSYARHTLSACQIVEKFPDIIAESKRLIDIISTMRKKSKELEKVSNNLSELMKDTFGTLVLDNESIPSLDEMAVQEYLASGGNRCPYCKSKEITFGKVLNDDDNDLVQLVTCTKCNTSWKDTYRLTTIKSNKIDIPDKSIKEKLLKENASDENTIPKLPEGFNESDEV